MHRRTRLLALLLTPLSAAIVVAPAGRAAAAPDVPVTNNAITGNWAGYVVPTGSVASVTGNWTVPDAGTLPPGVSSTWAGIGGFNSGDLIQAGTQQVSPPLNGFLAGGSYAAWYEMLPAAPVFFSGCSPNPACPVAPGDAMTVTISHQAQGWTITMVDAGRWTFSRSGIAYASTQSSAEWIHESPSLLGLFPIPVGNSGTVHFDGANSFEAAGVTGNIAAGPGMAVDAVPGETTTSALDSDGDGFLVCTYTASCPAPAS